jgi:vacuolar-type H+-ATPase subunit E/Vma4
MSFDSILTHIQDTAQTEAEKIIQQAKKEAERILQEARLQADKLYQELVAGESYLYEKEKQKLIVQARLQGKKNLLGAKQELIDEVFEKLKLALGKNKFKKEQVSQDKVHEVSEDTDFYLKKIRPDYEVEISALLFK